MANSINHWIQNTADSIVKNVMGVEPGLHEDTVDDIKRIIRKEMPSLESIKMQNHKELKRLRGVVDSIKETLYSSQ